MKFPHYCRLLIHMTLLLVVVFVLGIQPTVNAISATSLNAILRNTASYGDEPNENSISCSEDAAGSTLSGSDNIQKAFNYFAGKGLTPVLAAAVLGNLKQESSLNPTVIQGGGSTKNPATVTSAGWGIAQWTPGSKTPGLATANKITGPIYELGTQLDLVYAEMQGSAPTGYKNVLAGMKKTSSLSEAVEFFRANFESGTPGNRQQYARDILKQYGGSDADTTTVATGDAASADTTATTGDDEADGGDTGSEDTSGADCTSAAADATDGDATAVAGKGILGNCDGKGSTAAVHCGQCVAYVEWALIHFADPKKGPYAVLTAQSGPGFHAAYTVTDTLKAKGFTVNRTPAVHATFTMPPSVLHNRVGHTGMVSQVNTDSSGKVTSILVEESNWSGPETYGQRTLDAAYIKSHDMLFAHTEVGWHE